MRYLGGKARIGKKIAAVLNPMLVGGAPYYEPFCGGCNVAQHIVASWRLLSDAHPQLIAMWKAVQKGWVPPASVSEEEYAAAKRGELSPELTAFIGFGCSFGGKWFGGYARGGEGRSYASNARNSIMKKLPGIADAHFDISNFSRLKPRPQSVVYCDPPYAGTTSYAATGAFNHGAFWDWVRVLVDDGQTVVVSEYAAPEDFVCIAEFATKLDMRDAAGKSLRIERLFTHATRRDIQTNP